MYATQQDLVDRYGDDALFVAADRDRDGAIDTAAVDRALDDASGEINLYVGQRYTLPLAQVPGILTALCVDIALYKLSTGSAYTEQHEARYRNAVKLLAQIAKGQIQIFREDGTAPDAAIGEVEITGPGRQFSRYSMGRLT